jgi:hypothetical protein
MDVQRRENDLVLGTFGRSFYVLDDYSPLRGVTAESLRQDAALFPLRHAYQFPTLGQYRATDGNWASPNPPYGAVLTYNVGKEPPGIARDQDFGSVRTPGAQHAAHVGQAASHCLNLTAERRSGA